MTRAEGFRLREPLRAEATDLLVGRQHERERAAERAHVRLLNRGQRGRDEAFRVARAAPVELPLALRQRQSLGPRGVEGNRVGVTDERKLYFVRLLRREGEHLEFLDAFVITVRRDARAHPRGQRAGHRELYYRAVRLRRGRVDRHQLCQRRFYTHKLFVGEYYLTRVARGEDSTGPELSLEGFEARDDLVLRVVAAGFYYEAARDGSLAHGRAREREDDCGQKVFLCRARD